MSKCNICNNIVDNLQEHILICENNLISKEYENLIPCEICNTLVKFDDYQEHINNCNNPLQSLNFSMNNTNNTDNIVNLLYNFINLTNEYNNLNQQGSQEESPISSLNQEESPTPTLIDDDDDDDDSIPALIQEESPTPALIQEESPTPTLIDDDDDDDDESMPDLIHYEEPNLYNENINNLLNNLNFTFIPENNIVINTLNNLEQNNNYLNNLVNINNQENNYEELTNISETIGNYNISIKNKEIFFERKKDKIIDCPICVSKCNNYVTTICGHDFCEECIIEWLNSNNNCPLCNYEFIEK